MLAIIDSSALIGIKNFISLLPFLKAPVYITTTNSDVAKVLFVNKGNICSLMKGDTFERAPLYEATINEIDIIVDKA